MPITLAKIAANTSTVTFDYMGDPITVTYFPGLVTEKIFAQMQGFANMTEATFMPHMNDFNKTLTRLIKSWDVYEDEEQTVMFPLDPERMAELPLAFRIQLVSEITTDIRPEAVAPQTT